MFLTFFYLLRASGINVSLSEWLTLMEGLRMDLHDSTLSGFYTLCRSVLLHSEADFDRFDQVFMEFFKDVPWQGELPQELLDLFYGHSLVYGRRCQRPAELVRMDLRNV